MPIVLSADEDTLSAQDLVEALQKPTTNAPFATINYVKIFNIIPKDAEHQ